MTTMAPKKPKKTGRATFDHRGNTIWEWQTDSGSFTRDIDTGKLKALQNDQLSLTDRHRKAETGFDPYNTAARAPRGKDSGAKPRKSIDDLRKLSEEIKRTKRQNGHG